MCGRYILFDEDDLIEIRRLIEEALGRRPEPGRVPLSFEPLVSQTSLFDISNGTRSEFEDGDRSEMRILVSDIIEQYTEPETGARQLETLLEIFPSNMVPVMVLDQKRPVYKLMKWGFPHWDITKKSILINAKAETVSTSRFWKSYLDSRCVVPSTGYYEWRHGGGNETKEKFLFHHAGQKMLYMAGIYGTHHTESGTLLHTFAILTTTPSETVSKYHDRMPVILDATERELWLRDHEFAASVLKRAGVELEALPVHSS